MRFEAIHSILSSDGNILTVSELCETAGVSRPGYCRWLSAAGAEKEREARDREDFGLILEAYRHRGFEEVKAVIDEWMDYYNNERYQWQPARLSPNEYCQYIQTGVYPLPVNNIPPIPEFEFFNVDDISFPVKYDAEIPNVEPAP